MVWKKKSVVYNDLPMNYGHTHGNTYDKEGRKTHCDVKLLVFVELFVLLSVCYTPATLSTVQPITSRN